MKMQRGDVAKAVSGVRYDVLEVARGLAALWACDRGGCAFSVPDDSSDLTVVERDGKPWPPAPEYPDEVRTPLVLRDSDMPDTDLPKGGHVAVWQGRCSYVLGNDGTPRYMLVGYAQDEHGEFLRWLDVDSRFAVWHKMREG